MSASNEPNTELIGTWLELAQRNSTKCFICKCIADANPTGVPMLGAMMISGIEVSPDAQLHHLAACVGGTGGARNRT